MKPGIYEGISNSDYHGGEGISKSGLDLVGRSPLHFKAVRDAANDNEPTPAQAIGTAAHAIILEPKEFAKDYCLGLRPQDVPDAVMGRDPLVAMVEKLNEGRQPKLATGGSKAEVVERILANQPVETWTPDQLDALKGADLKEIINQLNTSRTGLLSTSGSIPELAELLRANGMPVKLWSEVQAEWLQNNGHRQVLSQEQFDQLRGMREAVMAHPAARFFLTKAKNVVVDLKTTDDASLEGFSKSIANWGYDVQHPYYLDGLRLALEQSDSLPPAEGRAELSAYWHDPVTGVLCRCRPDYWQGSPDHFIFIAVEKKAPYAVGVYVLDADSVTSGRAQYRANLDKYAHCVANDNWPGYGDKVQTISVPAWHLRKNEHLVAGQ
jgi:exodeoxyribonuclease VIII